MKNWLLSVIIGLLLIFVFASPIYAMVGPQAYLTEYVTGDY